MAGELGWFEESRGRAGSSCRSQTSRQMRSPTSPTCGGGHRGEGGHHLQTAHLQ